MGWLLPVALSVIVANLVATIYVFSAHGYPLLATVAWSLPIGATWLAGLALSGWIGIFGFVLIVPWTAMWMLEPVRQPWYQTLFGWRPPGSGES